MPVSLLDFFILPVLRCFCGAVLFRSLCPSPNSSYPFWLLALTFRSSRPAFCGRLTSPVRYSWQFVPRCICAHLLRRDGSDFVAYACGKFKRNWPWVALYALRNFFAHGERGCIYQLFFIHGSNLSINPDGYAAGYFGALEGCWLSDCTSQCH